MQLYTKIIDGEIQIKPAKKIVIKKDGMQIINPSEEMLLEDGWKLYVPKVYEPTEEELLQREKNNLKNEILRYDSSIEVNEFYINGSSMWLDKATRVGLKLRFEAELESEKTDTVLWYNDVQFPLNLDTAMKMLNAIELYASACYDKTQEHLAAVTSLQTIDEIKSYNYKDGYPDKLNF